MYIEELFRSLIYWFVVSAIQEERLDVARSLPVLRRERNASFSFLASASIPSHRRLRRCGADAERRASHHRPHHHILRPLARSAAFSLCHFWWMWMLLCLYVPIGYERNETPSPNDNALSLSHLNFETFSLVPYFSASGQSLNV